MSRLNFPWPQIVRGLVLLGALLAPTAGSIGKSETAEAPALQMEEIHDHGLRIIAPTILELRLISEKREERRRHQWDLFGTPGHNLPAAPDFAVSIDHEPVGLRDVGYKRRVISAPLSRWKVQVGHFVYLRINQPIKEGSTVEVRKVQRDLWPDLLSFVTVAGRLRLSPVIHVNQVGYAPSLAKQAIIGFYLGTLGELEIPNNQKFFVIDDATGKPIFKGHLKPRVESGFQFRAAPYQKVLAADFSTLTRPGSYRVMIPGYGASLPFFIHAGIPAAFARSYALGLYHQRCGAENDLPYTRFAHGVCHIAPAAIPTADFKTVRKHLSETAASSATDGHSVPLISVETSLYPFVRQGYVDVTGGHHDAGDYSKYTLNSAQLIHYLLFAADSLPGTGDLDNLGLPESGDGKSDLLQIAKWEADFLTKMQDEDGGFYFLVYPRDRRYESDVLPDRGDPQVVFPKNTAATAAAVAALAQASASPRFRQEFPAAAEQYRTAANRGWAFLERAWQTHGREKAYQKITHYGDWSEDKDEIAWAATELFLATGEKRFHDQVLREFNPQDPKTRRWGWWRLYESYGNAVRSYAFAARSGRISKAKLDPTHLAASEAEIMAAGQDALRYASANAYGTSFPLEDKRFGNAGWYFSIASAFDLVVAHQIEPNSAFTAAMVSNIDFESGTNPNNIVFLTGLGWNRQREIVHQYAQNDPRVLPPSGLPLGSVQRGFEFTSRYRRVLAEMTFPADEDADHPYPLYDRWSDTFNTTTEFTIVTQARGLSLLAYLMAQTPVKKQPWKYTQAEIVGVPETVRIGVPFTATLRVPGLDLKDARIVWESEGATPTYGQNYKRVPDRAGLNWIEAEVLWPDGRRAFARRIFRVGAGNP